MNDPSLNEPISGESRSVAGDGIDLDRVWANVAAEVWRRHPGRLERTAGRLLRSPGLARALLTTPSLLLPWLIASAVVLAVGALTQVGAGQPLVWLSERLVTSPARPVSTRMFPGRSTRRPRCERSRRR